jgi:thioredoxin-related protein
MPLPATRPAVRAALFLFVSLGATPPPASAAEPIRWRTDYNTARKEAQDKGLPLLVEVGTEDCYYCRKLETTTFRDPRIASLLASGFVPLRVDANREPALARALKVQVYPTLVLAGADGKIHAFIEGYMEAERLVEHMKRTVANATTADWAARDFNEASKSIAAADYPRAVSLLKNLVKEAGDKPVGAKAKQVLDEVEKQAAGRVARAKDLELRGQTAEAMDALTDVMKTYAGTDAAADAAARMAGISDRPETQQLQRQRRARDLLALAKEEFRGQRYHDCLQKCEQLADSFADLPEGKEAQALASEVKNHPERLAVACEQMNEKTAAMYLALAESWRKKGQDREAIACLEKVTKLSPNSKQAELAQSQLAQLRGKDPAIPAGLKKNP